LKWLKEQGFSWDANVFGCAAQNGTLENKDLIKVFIWLKEQECPWNDWTFEMAAKNGNLENMK
jgi:hypothetical protein